MLIHRNSDTDSAVAFAVSYAVVTVLRAKIAELEPIRVGFVMPRRVLAPTIDLSFTLAHAVSTTTQTRAQALGWAGKRSSLRPNSGSCRA